MTDRSRKVLKIAETEAARVGSQVIEPEQILLALAIEGNGVGGAILHHLGASADSIREAILQIPSDTSLGTEDNKWSEESEQCIQRAWKQAQLLNHHYVGTEHLVLGVVSATNGRVPEILRTLGISPSSIHTEVYAVLGHLPSES